MFPLQLTKQANEYFNSKPPTTWLTYSQRTVWVKIRAILIDPLTDFKVLGKLLHSFIQGFAPLTTERHPCNKIIIHIPQTVADWLGSTIVSISILGIAAPVPPKLVVLAFGFFV